MNFQIIKIILWPKKNEFQYKTLDFKLGEINIITGESRTGKSAIIPIIDYCLGSGSCKIPVKTIRNACSWFGVIIQTDSSQILLARREPGVQKITDDMCLIEGKEVEIPKEIEKNTSADAVRKYLDQLSGLSFLDMEVDTSNQYLTRISFRDLMAFCVQPQNIVANPNTFFYRADSTEHRTKLINIFPYILGAATPATLAKLHELNRLEKILARKEHEAEGLKAVSEKWKIELAGWLAIARELGLIDDTSFIKDSSFENQLKTLVSLLNRNAGDASVSKQNIEHATEEIIKLREKEDELSLKLSSYKNRYGTMRQLMGSRENYRNSLQIQVERLSISRWLKDICESDNICPICGNFDTQSQEIIGKFLTEMEQIENTASDTEKIPKAFEREYENVKAEIDILTEELEAIKKSIKLQEPKDTNESRKYTSEHISRFLGKAQYASEAFSALSSDSKLVSEIEELKGRITDLKNQVNEVSMGKKIDSALKIVANFASRLMPLLDSERPDDPIKIDYKNLTLIITGQDGRDDYLWEIGSGSNWLAYHISLMLSFQIFFNQKDESPVPNFLAFDQPSQVYFPQKLSLKENELINLDPDPTFTDADRIAAKKIFSTMSHALTTSAKPFQIIVLEHADETIWGDNDRVYQVCEWRKNQKLIPEEWL